MKFEYVAKALQRRGYDIEFSSNNYEVNVLLVKDNKVIRAGVGESSEEALADLIIGLGTDIKGEFPGLSFL